MTNDAESVELERLKVFLLLVAENLRRSGYSDEYIRDFLRPRK